MLDTVGDPGLLSAPRLSPDLKTIAFQRTSNQNTDIWTFDLTRNTATRFTFEPKPNPDRFAIWSRDGKTIVYSRGLVVVERPANGVGPENIVANETGQPVLPTDISRTVAGWC